MPAEGTCPKGWPRKPDFVTLGDKPHNQFCNGQNRVYVFNVTPRSQEPYLCPHRGCKAPCEAWLPCVVYHRTAIRVWGPGGFKGDEVVRSSREAYPWEEQCPPNDVRCYQNYNLPRMVISDTNPREGSPTGVYEMCVAPTEKEIRGPNGMCRTFHLKSCLGVD